MTNREKLNAMSNEELATKMYQRLESFYTCGVCYYHQVNKCTLTNHCIDGILEWLESEAEE